MEPSYIFGGSTGIETPQELARKREIVDALVANSLNRAPQTFGEGLTAIGNALAGRIQNKRLAEKEEQARTEASSQFQAITGQLMGQPQPSGNSGQAGGGFVAQGGAAPVSSASRDAVVQGLVSRGMTPAQAQGVALNLHDESSLNPAAVGDNGAALGLAQWNGPRKAALEQFAAARGVPATDTNAQLDFLMHELGTSEAGAGAALSKAQTPQEAAVAFLNQFERPSEQNRARREAQYMGAQVPNVGDLSKLSELASNPYLPEGQRAMAQSLIDQQTRALGPQGQLDQLQMQKAQLDLDKAMQPERAQPVEVGGRLVDPATGQVVYEPPAGSGGEFGLTPVYGRDAQGNVVVMQIGKNGEAVATRIPEGITPDAAYAASERARGSELGKATGAAQMELAGAISSAEQASALIDSVANDPALEGITGMVQGRLPIVSQAGTDLGVKIDQLKGKAFLEAFASLKGGGAISEVEGAKAEAAIARLSRAQSAEAYRQSLSELQGILAAGVERAKSKAGAGRQQQPATASDDDLLRMYGGQ